MHERSLVRSLLSLIEDKMDGQPLSCLRAVHLSIGEFAGVELSLLRIAFDDAMKEREQCEVELFVSVVALRARCVTCRAEFDVDAFEFRCPECQQRQVEVIAGQEFILDRLEVET